MLEVLQTILYPIIVIMDWILSAVEALTSSPGLAIVILSLIVFLAVRPLRRMATRVQQREIETQKLMAGPIREAKAKYRGEQQFNEIERIYKQFDYHPIKSMRSTLVFVVQIPFLLSALFLLIHHPMMQGTPFLFISNLGAADQLLPLPFGGAFGVERINVLPIVLLGLSVVESVLTGGESLAATLRANIIGFVIFLIVYPLSAALVLYWTCNNLWSLIAALAGRSRPAADGAQQGDR